MNINEIQSELTRLQELVSGWGGEIPLIERELALDKLKSLYEAVRFVAHSETECMESSTTSSLPEQEPMEETPVMEADDEELVAFDFEMIPLDEELEENTLPMEEPLSPASEPAEEPLVMRSEILSEPIEETSSDIVEKEKVEDEDSELKPISEPVLESASEPISAPSSEQPQRQNNLFELEEIPVVRRSSRRTLKSLYTDPEFPKSRPYEEEVTLVEPVSEPSEEPNSTSMTNLLMEGTLPAESHAMPVLGEVLRSEERTLADTVLPSPDLGSTIAHRQTLEAMIALNDRFLLMRELFDNDKAAYEAGIAQLDAQDSLDDCIIYIAEEYPTWNPNSEGVKLLLELLERKYGEN